jgi:hypothetical protein
VRRGGGGGARALACIPTAAQPLDEAELHGLGGGLAALLTHLMTREEKCC